MTPESHPLVLTVPSTLHLIPLIRTFVETACQVGGLDAPSTNAVVLATHEAAHNAMRHAHRNDPEALLQVECRLAPGSIEVRLLDEGAPFDLRSVPHLNPGELRLGGRG